MEIGLITGIDPQRKNARAGGLIRAGVKRIDQIPRHRHRRVQRTYELILTGTQENIDLVTKALTASTPYAGQDNVDVFFDTTVGGTVASGFAVTTGNFLTINPRAKLRMFVPAGRLVLGKGGAAGALGGKCIRCEMDCELWYAGDVKSGGNGGSHGSGGGNCTHSTGCKGCPSCDTLVGTASGGSGGGGAGYGPTSGATESSPGSGSAGTCCNQGSSPECSGFGGICGSDGSGGGPLGQQTAIDQNGFRCLLIPQGGTITGAII
jgi:hypothetical protein